MRCGPHLGPKAGGGSVAAAAVLGAGVAALAA